MDLWQVIVLAIVQGLTEFLPISSSAHLILTSQLLGWPDQGLAFDVAVHAGTLVAVTIYFRRDLVDMITPGNAAGHRLLAYLIVATIPLLIAGFFFADMVETVARNARVIALASIGFGMLLWLADHFGAKTRPGESLATKDAVVVGLAQALALIPGTSRSGITITAGLFMGLTREAAARFAFLLSIPAIGAAGAWQALHVDPSTFKLGLEFAAGFLCSGITAYLTIGWFMNFVQRAGMTPFVIYRVLLGIVLLITL